MTIKGAPSQAHADADADADVSSSPAVTNEHNPTESSPLLANPVETGDVSNRKLGRYNWSPATYINIILLGLFLTSCGDELCQYANVKIFESIICYRFYEKHNPKLINIGRDKIGPGAINGVDEMWCKKADPVSAELASLLGGQAFFDGLPNLLFCLPAGWAADRIGRFPFLLLGVAALPLRAAFIQFVMYNWQAYDVQWSWLSAAFLIPAGGSYFTTTILYIICSDLTEANERASVFFRMGALNVSASLLMPPLAAWLMEYTPWIPAFLGLAFSVSCCLLCLLVPETLNYRQSDSSVAPDEPPPSPGARWTAKIRSSIYFITRDWRVPVLIVTFFVYTPIGNWNPLVLQYISKHYSMRISQATLYITIREAVHVTLLFLILPFLQNVFLRILNNCGPKKDLYLTRISLILTTVGWLFVGISPNIPTLVIGLVIASLGSGASYVTRSFITLLIPPHHSARVFALIGIVSGIGQMVAAPGLAQLFKYGIKLGGAWTGLPFTFVSIAGGVLTIILFIIRLRESEKVSTVLDVDPDDHHS